MTRNTGTNRSTVADRAQQKQIKIMIHVTGTDRGTMWNDVMANRVAPIETKQLKAHHVQAIVLNIVAY